MAHANEPGYRFFPVVADGDISTGKEIVVPIVPKDVPRILQRYYEAHPTLIGFSPECPTATIKHGTVPKEATTFGDITQLYKQAVDTLIAVEDREYAYGLPWIAFKVIF